LRFLNYLAFLRPAANRTDSALPWKDGTFDTLTGSIKRWPSPSANRQPTCLHSGKTPLFRWLSARSPVYFESLTNLHFKKGTPCFFAYFDELCFASPIIAFLILLSGLPNFCVKYALPGYYIMSILKSVCIMD
jgi:hypothetical protein